MAGSSGVQKFLFIFIAITEDYPDHIEDVFSQLYEHNILGHRFASVQRYGHEHYMHVLFMFM